MRSIRVTFDGGKTIETKINGTEFPIRDYYLAPGRVFDVGVYPHEDMRRAVRVEFLDREYGLIGDDGTIIMGGFNSWEAAQVFAASVSEWPTLEIRWREPGGEWQSKSVASA